LSSTAEELAAQAAALQEQVAYFRLEGMEARPEGPRPQAVAAPEPHPIAPPPPPAAWGDRAEMRH
ncbi:MAG TPA: toxin-antitoxin system HicB family antitoxin, partial [Vicinamibacteria bacterium]|nr:toxin-antitoxin system HicB family antitoxin [Vicinamibacteria bacterium]